MASNFYDTLFNAPEDKRFYGIYRGVVVDSNDPLEKNRLKVQVPQVTGTAVTNWAWPCLTVAGVANSFANGSYGSFQSFVTQTTTANTATKMTLNQVDANNGVTLTADTGETTNKSKIVFEQAGLYNIQWSGQFQNADNQLHDAFIWIRTGNGSGANADVAGSTGYISIPNKHGGEDGHTVSGWNYLLNVNKDDYLQFYWSTDSAQVSLQFYAAGTSPTRPTTASLIVTVDPVSTPLSAAGNGVWVMYEGGDPNFPVWMGVF
jgi:hypothetical protein